MKSLNNIIENFFSNVGAKPMTLREFIINLLNSEATGSPASDALSDNRLIDDLLDQMSEEEFDDFDRSRKIKGVNLHEFLMKNINKPISINVDVVDETSSRMPKLRHLRGQYVYNLNVDGEEFTWIRFKLYPWIPNNPKKR